MAENALDAEHQAGEEASRTTGAPSTIGGNLYDSDDGQ